MGIQLDGIADRNDICAILLQEVTRYAWLASGYFYNRIFVLRSLLGRRLLFTLIRKLLHYAPTQQCVQLSLEQSQGCAHSISPPRLMDANDSWRPIAYGFSNLGFIARNYGAD